MSVEVIMPQMGESIFEGTITKWLKKPGDTIDRDEPLFEISTDKVDAEIPSPAAGVLKEIKVEEGKTVPIQTVVALIDAPGTQAGRAAPARSSESAMASTTQPKPQPPVQRASAPVQAAPQMAVPAASAPSEEGEEETVTPDGKRIRSSPLVRRLARESGVDLGMIQGTGAGGRISKKDVLAAISAVQTSAGSVSSPERAATPTPPTAAQGAMVETALPRERIYFGHYEVQPMSVMRQRIADHMVLSKRVSPHVYSIDEADMTRVAQIRESARAEFEQKHQMKLTFMPFFVRACVDALRDFPTVNASVEGTNIILHQEINIGIAVALDWGLIVPVLKHAEEKNLLGLQRAISDLADRARAKKLKPEDVQESTFSITNPGTFGGLMGLPIINQPNVAILGIGAIQKRPVVINDAIAIRSMVYLTLSYDHRVVDGATAHRFMRRVKERLENWTEALV
ncbi:MAG TPA: 2-oxoglutarate dehydrogenase, E2 component, dihydrolipoamide succinyltransferase [Candidatus Acidoferrales bacterium]|nr:2-oxoglutarate dehydrogenase, E2 component, dihydrolipoamide succinyltransferase [Candidatus Acidoferrales bacterium]